jgi:type I restriction enzyme R subunit
LVSPHGIKESILEQVALEWLATLGWEVVPSSALEPSETGERQSYETVVLAERLRSALEVINPKVPASAIESAIHTILKREAPTLEQNNQSFHRLVTDGIAVDVAEGGVVKSYHLRLFDKVNLDKNDWLASSQFTVIDKTGAKVERRADIVLWVNGLPIAVIELKNPALQSADIWSAYAQLQTYKHDIPSLFLTNELLVIADDIHARVGSLTADDSRFQPWRTIDGSNLAKGSDQPLKVLIEGVFDKERLLDLITGFITFEVDRGKLVKKLAGYHQFHAVRRAVEETRRATAKKGDGKIGVVWHTQGSGKSLTMLFYAGKLVRVPELENPTIVVITDRNDLDDQLFGTFAQARNLLRQTPQQAEDRAQLRKLFETSASGGVYFTTIQKFLPPEGQKGGALSSRKNIIVIADEAHRSQYGLKSKVNQKGEIVLGLAQLMREALPNASFIGFTGTPIDLADKSTIQVFGDYIDIYDIRRAVEDKAVVPIYYENRLAKLELDDDQKPEIDPRFEEVTESEEESSKEKLKREWSALEAIAGTPKRLRKVAKDLVEHYEKRDAELAGKALVVCMSRRICVDLYDEIIKLRPAWAPSTNDDDEDDEGGGLDESGSIKVVMTGSASDVAKLRPHIRSKQRRERLAARFKDPKDPLKIVIVRDMWLTGFDAPCLHTLYVDKPMRGHNLMQAIARVNRVFGDKPGGLVVDYIGIAPFLKEAMKTYADAKGDGEVTHDQAQAVAVMKTELERCRDRFHGFDVAGFLVGTPKKRLAMLPAAREHVLKQKVAAAGYLVDVSGTASKAGDGLAKAPARGAKPVALPRTGGANKPDKKRPDGYDLFMDACRRLTQAFALAAPHEECDKIRDEVAFYQAVRVGLLKLADRSTPSSAAKLEHAVRQIVNNAVVTEEIIDVFSAAGLARPDISVLSDEFLEDVKNLEYKNLALELLHKLLNAEVKTPGKRGIVQSRKFSEMLEEAILRYQSRALDTAQVIEQLIELAKAIRSSNAKGEELKLSKEEFAFYDALADNESAVKKLKDEGLSQIARELTKTLRNDATTDWNVREQAQAKLRLAVKSVLRKFGYPPDAQEKAVKLVLEQAKDLKLNFVDGWSESQPPAWAKPPDSDVEAEQPFPYPIAVFDVLVESQVEAGLRFKTRLDGFERAMVFLISLQVARIREIHGPKADESILAALGGDLGPPRAAMGTWLEAARRLAAELPFESHDPVDRASRSLVNGKGSPSELANRLATEIVPLRNKHSHAVVKNEAVVAEKEGAVHALWKELLVHLAPLRETRLVSIAKIHELKGSGARYGLRQLQGGSRPFKVLDEIVDHKLENDWCYAFREGQAPLSLSPFLRCQHSPVSEQSELYVASGIRLVAAKGQELIELTSDETIKLKA